MLVQCPNCRTTYKVSENIITMPNPTFRCSRCKHIFVLGLKTNPTPVPKTTIPQATPSEQAEKENRELTFSFPQPDREPGKEVSEPLKSEQPPVTEDTKEKENQTPQSPIPEPFPFLDATARSYGLKDEPSLAIGKKELSLREGERDDHWSLSSSRAPDEKSFIIPKQQRSPLGDDTIERDRSFEVEWPNVSSLIEERKSSSALDPNREQPLSVVPFISLCWAVLLIFSLVTLMHRTYPITTETVIGTIPWLGSSVLRNNHLRHRIVLQSLRPSFQMIIGNREVFVISGVAVNRNPVSVREVRIEGYIFNAGGKDIESQTISVGNAISSKIIRDLTSQEISILQKLNPQRRFEIPPEESASFVIVFLKPRGEIKDFSCRVVSAEEA